jgi:hypothetical protein
MIEAEREEPTSFGSWYQDYVRDQQRVRLIWDGRDQWFVLQGGKDWHNLWIKRAEDLDGAGLEDFLAVADSNG